MAYDEHLAERIKQVLKRKHIAFGKKAMMGGLCFMVNDKMCMGVVGSTLMARVGPDFYKTALLKKGCREMDFTGKPMKGFVFVDPAGIDLDADLEYWVQKAIDYNPEAVAGRKTGKGKR